ncbi:MAG: hypothetical protein HZA22_04885 [Nitrospirae bacterium]|nr:hypothetical protein [Nitrospirota bacterium]MBI5694131.1 hypothetical protein [Nitrospirota bacterium]
MNRQSDNNAPGTGLHGVRNDSGSIIISVHLPKTAGTSLMVSLEEHFGPSLLKDFADYPINNPAHLRNRHAHEQSVLNAGKDYAGINCIHGHFLPAKYLLLGEKRKTVFITWLRNPVERVLSHYYFWKNTYSPLNPPPLHRRVVEEDWSLERFCLGPEVRNLYAQFMWGFPLAYFDFVGITEFFAEDLAYFSHEFLGSTLAAKKTNVGQNKGGSYDIDIALRKKIEEHHSVDMLIYNRSVERRMERAARIQGGGSMP